MLALTETKATQLRMDSRQLDYVTTSPAGLEVKQKINSNPQFASHESSKCKKF